MNDLRSGRAFMQRVQRLAPADKELGLIAYKEQYLLYLQRPATNFGHARWPEAEQEVSDAAAWLAAKPGGRILLVDQRGYDLCFKGADAIEVGTANRSAWSLVTDGASQKCVRRGNLDAARVYPPSRQ